MDETTEDQYHLPNHAFSLQKLSANEDDGTNTSSTGYYSRLLYSGAEGALVAIICDISFTIK